MAELDTSSHTLNNSSSKQKYSFSKNERFRPYKPISDVMYEMPTTRTSRVTSLGYGNKDIGLRTDKFVPPIGTYELGTQFKKDQHVGFNFGSGRAEMEMSGPFKDSKMLGYIPGPGRYDANRSTLQNRSSTLRQKLPDVSTRHLLKNPGPGTYGAEEMGKNNYYMTSKFKNNTNGKISNASKGSFLGRSEHAVGPGSYTINVEDLNPSGKYHLSNHESSKTRVFGKSQRQSLNYPHMLKNPGPGQYSSFSSFG